MRSAITSIIRYYFTGSKSELTSIRQYLYSRMATSYIHREPVKGNENLIYGVWILSLGFILLLTRLDIQFSRKADFLKISMGASAGRIVCKDILEDLLFNAAIAGAVYLILKDKIFIAYKLDFVLPALLVFCILNSLLYLTLFRADYKEIIYGANINVKLLANTYLLKAVIMIVLIISLACNLTAIEENAELLGAFDEINKLDGYNTLNVTPVRSVSEDQESTFKLRKQLFLEAYLSGKVLLSTSWASLDEPVIILNEAAMGKTVSNPEQFPNRTDNFVVYIPEDKAGRISDYEIEFALRTTASGVFGLEEYSSDVMTYKHSEVLYLDLRKESGLPFGFELLTDPVIVYCNVSVSQLNELLAEDSYVEYGDKWDTLLFDLNDTSVFTAETKDKIEDIYFNGVIEQCSRHKQSFLRTVLIYSILSIFMLVLCILLISAIVRMEYIINSKEIALKRILGYSIIKRNMAIVLINAFSVFIAFTAGLILSSMYDIFDILTLSIVSSVVFLLDTTLMLSNMAAAENKNAAHILKGGSL